MVWNIFYFSIYWEQSSQVTNIFQRGWNHQPVIMVYQSWCAIIEKEQECDVRGISGAKGWVWRMFLVLSLKSLSKIRNDSLRWSTRWCPQRVISLFEIPWTMNISTINPSEIRGMWPPTLGQSLISMVNFQVSDVWFLEGICCFLWLPVQLFTIRFGNVWQNNTIFVDGQSYIK